MLDYPTLLETFKKLLRDNSLKFTKQREVTLKTLYQNSGHFTPEELYNLIKEQYPDLTIGIATIYRTLGLLEGTDIVNSLSFGSKGKKYELNNKAHHDHLICIKCEKLIEFYDEIIEEQQKKISDKFNFKMMGHTMHITGICQECQEKQTRVKPYHN